ncbi:MAG: hypothetical protein ACR2PI_06420 [Hyphomicrobiaceae bacterium]
MNNGPVHQELVKIAKNGNPAGILLAESHFYFHKAADGLGLSDKVRTILLTPHRLVKVGIAIEEEDGELQCIEGRLPCSAQLRPRANEGGCAIDHCKADVIGSALGRNAETHA